jgi:hypothetical protein
MQTARLRLRLIHPKNLLLEAILAVPFQEMRMWTVGNPMRRKRLTGLVDN